MKIESMNEIENKIILELKQLTLNYDKFIIDNCFNKMKYGKNTYVLSVIEKDDFIISWSFDIEHRSAWLRLDKMLKLDKITRQSLNAFFYNKKKNIYCAFENFIRDKNNNDFNKFLVIFEKFYDLNNQ